MSGWPAVALVTIVSLWVGCTTAQVREFRAAPTAIQPHEAVAIVLHQIAEKSSDETRVMEEELFGCISDALRKPHPGLRVVPPDKFRRAAFSDLDPEAAPTSLESLAVLLTHPVFRERIDPLRIHYVVSVGGRWEGKEDAFVGYPVPGAIFTWYRGVDLVASVLDVKQIRAAGEIDASVKGHGWLFMAGFLFPIGLPATTEGRACQDLGQAIAKFLTGEKPPRP